MEAGGRGIGLLEGFKDAPLLFRRDADAGIRDGERDDLRGMAENRMVGEPALRGETHAHLDVAARGELEGVRDQVLEDLPHPLRVAVQTGRQICGQARVEREFLRVGHGLEMAGDAVAQPGERHFLDLHGDRAGFNFRQVENVVDEVEQIRAGGIDELGKLPLLGREIARFVFRELLAEEEDDIQGSAQLVGHVGEELGLVARGARQLGGFLLQRGAGQLDLGVPFHEQPGFGGQIRHALRHPTLQVEIEQADLLLGLLALGDFGPQRRLGPRPLGDVQVRSHHPFGLPLRIRADGFHRRDVATFPVFRPPDAEGARAAPEPAQGVLQDRLVLRQVLGQHSPGPCLVLHQSIRRRRDAIEPEHLRIPPDLVGEDIPFPDAHLRRFRGQAHVLLARAQRRRRALPRRHVLEIADHAVLAVRQRDALRLPFVGLLHADVVAEMLEARRNVALPRLQRASDDRRAFPPKLRSPEGLQHFADLAPDHRLHRGEDRHRLRVHFPHPELRVHHIHPARRLLDDLGKQAGIQAQCRFSLLAFGDVTRGAKPFEDFATGIQPRDRPRERPADRAVHTQNLVFQFKDALGPDGFADDRHHARLVIGMNVFLQPVADCRFRVGDEIPAQQMAHLAPIRAHAIHHI